jgi:hypothetical protein
MAIYDCGNGFFHRLILDKLIVPFNERIFTPVQKRYNKLLGRNTDLSKPGMSSRTLDILVTTLECVVAVGCFALAVTLLYNLKTTKTRMIAAPFASFACVVPIIFLGKDLKAISMLMAG